MALSESDAGPFLLPSKESAFQRAYPLTRHSAVFINRSPGKPVDAKVKEFLRYILSRDGMEAIVADRAFLPLNAATIRAERDKLE